VFTFGSGSGSGSEFRQFSVRGSSPAEATVIFEPITQNPEYELGTSKFELRTERERKPRSENREA